MTRLAMTFGSSSLLEGMRVEPGASYVLIGDSGTGNWREPMLVNGVATRATLIPRFRTSFGHEFRRESRDVPKCGTFVARIGATFPRMGSHGTDDRGPCGRSSHRIVWWRRIWRLATPNPAPPHAARLR